MATCSRTILADENVTVSGNTFSCVGDIPVGVALFVVILMEEEVEGVVNI